MKQLGFSLLLFLTGFHIFSESGSIDSQLQNIQSMDRDSALSVANGSAGDTDDTAQDTSSIIERAGKLWKLSIKNAVVENVLFSVSVTEENIQDNKNLLGVYYYDNNKMLHKTVFTGEKIKVPLSIIHSNFVKLLQVGKKNVYVSSLFSVDKKCLYFIAKHLSDGYMMFLFSLPLESFPNENFILFDEKGRMVLNIGFQAAEVRKIENLLKNSLDNLDDTVDDTFDCFSIIESSSLMYFYAK